MGTGACPDFEKNRDMTLSPRHLCVVVILNASEESRPIHPTTCHSVKNR